MSVYSSNIRKIFIINDVVDISEGYFYHEIPPTSKPESIDLRKKYGILPSERFGILESGQKMRFCVGVRRYDNLEEGSKINKRYIRNDDGSMNKYMTFNMKDNVIGLLSLIISHDIEYYLKNIELFSYIKDPSIPLTEEERRVFGW